jgi:uncharacterized protein YycO
MQKRYRISSINLLFFPVVTIILFIAIVLNNQQVIMTKNSILFDYIASAREGKIGYGFNQYYGNDISFADLEPGDIILGSYPGCAYGEYSHAAIYIGNGQVAEGYVDLGINVQPVGHFREYQKVCLLRVEAPMETKTAAVEYVLDHLGEMFYPVAFKDGDRFWNCTKIMWKAYYEQGLDLDYTQDVWVAPDVFYNSPHIVLLREKGR